MLVVICNAIMVIKRRLECIERERIDTKIFPRFDNMPTFTKEREGSNV